MVHQSLHTPKRIAQVIKPLLPLSSVEQNGGFPFLIIDIILAVQKRRISFHLSASADPLRLCKEIMPDSRPVDEIRAASSLPGRKLLLSPESLSQAVIAVAYAAPILILCSAHPPEAVIAIPLLDAPLSPDLRKLPPVIVEIVGRTAVLLPLGDQLIQRIVLISGPSHPSRDLLRLFRPISEAVVTVVPKAYSILLHTAQPAERIVTVGIDAVFLLCSPPVAFLLTSVSQTVIAEAVGFYPFLSSHMEKLCQPPQPVIAIAAAHAVSIALFRKSTLLSVVVFDLFRPGGEGDQSPQRIIAVHRLRAVRIAYAAFSFLLIIVIRKRISLGIHHPPNSARIIIVRVQSPAPVLRPHQIPVRIIKEAGLKLPSPRISFSLCPDSAQIPISPVGKSNAMSLCIDLLQ